MADNDVERWADAQAERDAALDVDESAVTLDDLTACVDTSADTIVNELLCLQFRRNAGADWPCPTDVP